MAIVADTSTAVITIHVDGVACRAAAGTSVAAALLNAETWTFRRSVHGEPRGPLCGMGICHECRVTIDGVAHRRACLVLVADGMRVQTGSDGA
jgi:D-hydroxyproline dehydrogenase subunit gamma